ncbi:pentapeptide repeat-containing protein [Pseudanabaena sp. CCNP1317]|uniref:pentapeptide repeat-containing protein n=1 Tax=Pseudanabaena sp. CCNP1317 TaxID=3110253 RepID=UPI003A4C788C
MATHSPFPKSQKSSDYTRLKYNLSFANLTASKLILIEFAGTNLNGANFRNAIVENIGSIEAADFTNALNLAPKIRTYFCSLASGNVAETGLSTKSTLNCLP